MFVEEKTQGEITEAPARTMKLSEAIRIGARLTKQCSSCYVSDSGDASCAYGAAAIAMGGSRDLAGQLHVRNKDADEAMFRKYGVTIVGANDKGWTREAIADTLEALGY